MCHGRTLLFLNMVTCHYNVTKCASSAGPARERQSSPRGSTALHTGRPCAGQPSSCDPRRHRSPESPNPIPYTVVVSRRCSSFPKIPGSAAETADLSCTFPALHGHCLHHLQYGLLLQLHQLIQYYAAGGLDCYCARLHHGPVIADGVAAHCLLLQLQQVRQEQVTWRCMRLRLHQNTNCHTSLHADPTCRGQLHETTQRHSRLARHDVNSWRPWLNDIWIAAYNARL